MKKTIIVLFLLIFAFTASINAQVDTTVAEEIVQPPANDGKKPVRNPFEACLLIDQQTIVNPNKGALELWIHHRFGKFGNGTSDLWGIYAPSNIRLGVLYGLTKNFSLGFGTEKNNKMQEFIWKYSIIKQTRDNSIPIGVTYFGNFVIEGKDSGYYGQDYAFVNRFSYFHQLLIARKFNERLTLQLAPSFCHFNSVDTLSEHDKIGLSFGGRFQIWNSNSFIFEIDQPLNIKGIAEHLPLNNPPTANYAFGIEFGTSTHAFQVFLANYEHIIAQKNLAYNRNEFFKGDMLLGFNITVRLR